MNNLPKTCAKLFSSLPGMAALPSGKNIQLLLLLLTVILNLQGDTIERNVNFGKTKASIQSMPGSIEFSLLYTCIVFEIYNIIEVLHDVFLIVYFVYIATIVEWVLHIEASYIFHDFQ